MPGVWRKQHGRLQKKRLIQSELSVTNLLQFEHLLFEIDLWRNQLWQWLEESCRKPVPGVWRKHLIGYKGNSCYTLSCL